MRQGGRRGEDFVESMAAPQSVFPHFPGCSRIRLFYFRYPPWAVPCRLMRVRWQTGTLYNRTGVVPVRLNTVYALNRLQLTGLEPGPPAQYLADLTSPCP